VKAMVIIFAGLFVERPGGLLNARKYYALLSVRRLLLCRDIPVAKLRVLISPRFLKPRMINRRMVHHQVRDDANAVVPRGLCKFHEISESAVPRVHIVVIGDVVTMITSRRWIKRL